MSEAKHVHDCTGPSATCPCGYKLKIPRFGVSFDVYDNQTKTSIVSDCFMCDDLYGAVAALEEAARELDEADIRAEAKS